MIRRRALMSANDSILPSGYDQVLWVQSVQEASRCIRTGIVMNQPIRLTGKALFPAASASQINYASSSENGMTGHRLGCQSGKWMFAMTSGVWTGGTCVSNVVYDYNALYSTGTATLSINGVQIAAQSKSTYPKLEIGLFGQGYNNNRVGIARLYENYIYQSSVLVRHFIPCRRKSDGKVGFYDLCGSSSPYDGTPFYSNDESRNYIYGRI